MNRLNPLLHESFEPPVYENKPRTINQGLCIRLPIEDAYQGTVFGNLSTGLRRAAPRLRHRHFAPHRSGQNTTAGGAGLPGVQDGGGHQSLPMGSILFSSSSSLQG